MSWMHDKLKTSKGLFAAFIYIIIRTKCFDLSYIIYIATIHLSVLLIVWILLYPIIVIEATAYRASLSEGQINDQWNLRLSLLLKAR
jgi:hypothetical protein